MKVLIIDLYKERNPNRVGSIAEEMKNHADIDNVRLYSLGFSFDSLRGYDGVIFTGSNSRVTYERAEDYGVKDYIAGLLKTGVNILGICGGDNILAQTFGYDRVELDTMIRGSKRMTLTESGKEDPLFDGVSDTFVAWDSYLFFVDCDDEEGVLARNYSHPQAIRYHPLAQGVHFHPEVRRPHFKSYEGWKIFRNFAGMMKR